MTRTVVVAALAVVCALFGAAPASARARLHVTPLIYDITSASMSEQLTFQGDGGPACARVGVCDYSGTVTYGFGGIEDGIMALLITRRGHHSGASGFGEMLANGLTKGTVTGPGGGPPCSDQILHHDELFDVTGTAGRVRLSFHSPDNAPNYMRTYCTGPSDDDLWHSGALPRLSVPVSRLRKRHVVLTVSSRRPIHTGPFLGTVDFTATISLRQIHLPGSLLQLFTSASLKKAVAAS